MHEEYEAILLDLDEETGVATITLNRPDALNAMNVQMREDIADALDTLAAADDEAEGVAVRLVVIEGAGDRAFSAGADITEFSGFDPRVGPRETTEDVVQNYGAPVVAKIDGFCLGGGFELALACDFRVASESSRVGFPEVNLGLLPGAGGAQYVTRLAGSGVAKELAMTGRHVPAPEAAELGLVNHVYDDDAFEEEAGEFVAQLAGQAPLALRAIKNSVDHGTQVGLAEARAFDQRLFPSLLSTDDHQEGARGFMEDDYEPEFKGK